MGTCARCGDPAEVTPPRSDYSYCDECWEVFQTVMDEGVFVRSRHENRMAERVPYSISGPSVPQGGPPQSQVEALAKGKNMMEIQGVRGVFHYQPTGSYWLIDEYLEAHPGIAGDVEELRSGGLVPSLDGVKAVLGKLR